MVTGPTSGTSQLQQTLFSYFRQINVLEFKGINDPLTVADYNRNIGLITDPDVLWHKILEIMQMKPTIHESTRPYIDQFFRTMPEEMWKMPTFREALEEKQRYGQYQGAQRMLLNQLRRKFAQIPESVVQKMESTKNLEQLNDWAIQIMTAESLADMGLL